MQTEKFAQFAAAVGGRLGINQAAAANRLRALGGQLVHSLAIAGEAALDEALDHLLARGVEDVSKLLAHGPHEQARAALAPEQIAPKGTELANLNGYQPDELKKPTGEAPDHNVGADVDVADDPTELEQ